MHMKVNNIEGKVVNIAYVFCVIYLSIFTFLYKMSRFPYITVGIMSLLLFIDALLVKKVCINKIVLLVALYILCMFFVAFLKYGFGENVAYFQSFIVLGTIGFYFGNKQANYKRVIIISSVFFSFYMLLGGGKKQLQIDYFNMSCAMIPGICSLILASIILMNEGKKKMGTLFLVGGAYSLLLLAVHGSRSSVVSVFAFIILLFWYYYDIWWLKLVVLCSGAGLVGFLLNMEKILLYLSDYLSNRGVELYFIDKSVEKLHGDSGITSGRIEIQKQVFENLNPINIFFGKGISSFEAMYGTYPHNLVLNLFVDYGMIGVVSFSVIVVQTLKLLKMGNKDEKMMIILLFSSAIVPLFFSFTYWRFPAFFLYIGIILAQRKRNSLIDIANKQTAI